MNKEISRTVDENGEARTFRTSYAYEDVSVHSSTGAGKSTIQNAYVTTETDESGYHLSETYQDPAGNTVREKQDGLYTDTLYDKFGKEIGTYEAGKNPDSEDGMLTLNLYDKNGNQTDTVLRPEYGKGGGFYVGANTIVQSTKFSEAGKETAATDALGNTTNYGYNEKGELNEVVLPDGSKTSYKEVEEYVNDSQQTKAITTDAKGQVSQTISNGSGEQAETRDLYEENGEDRSIWTKFAYDEKGNLEKETNAKGNYKLYHYDSNNRLIRTDYYEKGGTGEEQTLKTTYTYDLSGNVTKMCDYKISGSKETLYRYTGYTYDKQKRLVSFAECDGPNVPTAEELEQHKVSYTYDRDGNVTGVRYAFVKDGVKGLTYHYNADKWLTEITADMGGLTEKSLRIYTYDDYGKVAQMEDFYGFTDGGGSMLRAYDYDGFGRTTAMTYKDSSDPDQVKEAYQYEYDKNNNITKEHIVSNYAAEGESGVDYTKTYAYDSLGRLIGSDVVDKKGTSGSLKSASYAYDEVGNRTKETVGNEATTYDYNGLNQLTGSETKEQKSGKTTSHKMYTYDRNGNQIGESDSVTGQSRILRYGADNRLVRYAAKEGDTVVLTQENLYNGNGQRIQKKEVKGQDTKENNYYYQGSTVLYTADGAGKRTSLNLMGIEDNVIATSRDVVSDEMWYLYNKDVRESTSSLVDGTGALAAAYAYDDFGNTDVRVGEGFYNEICYSGQVYDAGTGLYYYNARYYDPEDGRFMSQDTYRGEQKEPETWHRYAYCANNPINYIDPSGHKRLGLHKKVRYVWKKKEKKKNTSKRYTNINCKAVYVGYPTAYFRSRIGYTINFKKKTVEGRYIKGYEYSDENAISGVDVTADKNSTRWTYKGPAKSWIIGHKKFTLKFKVGGGTMLTYHIRVDLTVMPVSWKKGKVKLKVIADPYHA